ncbi:MAG: hypothetical protein QNJ60_07165 [Xenococcaceae cyanobacterium MO_188.B19]|nr:hypothetical protein [Xenococcaceae cyanobacterium MO_188.B19]
MSFLHYTQSRSLELAKYLETTAKSPADFSNEYYSDNWHIFERLLPANYK